MGTLAWRRSVRHSNTLAIRLRSIAEGTLSFSAHLLDLHLDSLSSPLMASEDASTILAEFVSSLENLPLEVAHIMAEIAAKESQLAGAHPVFPSTRHS